MSNASPQNPDSPNSGTELETDDEIRLAIAAKFGPVPESTVAKPPAAPTVPPTSPAKPYRPTLRPSVGELTILDDGQPDGELIRIRADRFVVGRSDGDLRIPHDGLIAAKHLEITRSRSPDGDYWIISDLAVTSGLFVRVSKALLPDRAQFLAGKGRFRFEAAAGPSQPTACIVEMMPNLQEVRRLLSKAENWLGTDPSCEIHQPNDPFLELRHLVIFQDAKGWHIKHNKTLNGLWLRVNEVTVENGCLFQIGEQRFRFKVGGSDH